MNHERYNMLSASKDKKQTIRKKAAKATGNKKVKDYGNEPFFVKKAEESKAFLEKHGFPKELLSKK